MSVVFKYVDFDNYIKIEDLIDVVNVEYISMDEYLSLDVEDITELPTLYNILCDYEHYGMKDIFSDVLYDDYYLLVRDSCLMEYHVIYKSNCNYTRIYNEENMEFINTL